ALPICGNQISFTTLEGSWLVFDQIRLVGPSDAVLQADHRGAYVRSVEAGNYQLDETIQPLLIDLEHLEGKPSVELWLDQERILQQTLEQGRYVLEAPMPAVTEPKTSDYGVKIDGGGVIAGRFQRARQRVHHAADYSATRMGAAHPRWMIAPGPRMPFSMVKLIPHNQNPGWVWGYDPCFESVGS